MRVAIDVTPLRGLQTGRATGVGRVVDGLLGALPAVAPDVTVVPWELTRHGRHLPPAVLVRLWAHGDVPSGRRIVPPADVVHGTNFVVPPAAKPAVVTVYDCWCARRPRTCDPTIAAAVATVRGAVRRGAWVHVTSESAADEVRELFGAERVAVVPLAASPVPPADPSPIDVPYVLAIGTTEHRKGFDVLVRAAARAGLHLVLAGAEGGGEPAVTDAIAATGATVTRLRHVDEATRAALLRGAAVLAYPSRDEGFGLPPLEAMSVGVPVVATRAGAIPEVVGDAALLVEVDDVDALADALRTASSDEAERTRLVEAGRNREATFTWARTATGLAALWREAASS
ncbi:MAG TPA: glycosyltransferase family 1 protein [Acidimicrobiales bacterium]|jgi:glycosyltransferase involved in cell wall biosynthesis